MTELDSFLVPIDGPSASGVELRNDMRFHALERLIEPASRAMRLRSEDGSNVRVNWSEVLDEARALSAQGRDLRLLAIVARAAANEDGLQGLASGLSMLTRTVEQFWDNVHPTLRENPSRREAATRRINAIYQIESQDSGILGDLEFAAILSPRGIGPLSGSDLAAGTLSRSTVLAEGPSGLGDKEQAALAAAHETRVNRVAAGCRAIAAEQPETYQLALAGAAASRAALSALEAALDAHVSENGIGVKFNALGTFLARIEATLKAHQAADAAAAPATEAEMAEPQMNGALPNETRVAAAPPGQMQVNSRRDVERCLDLIIAFYERTEPSSPIPHLARRMRKMVPMNFLQLMEEIAPSGMKEFRTIAGALDEKTKP